MKVARTVNMRADCATAKHLMHIARTLSIAWSVVQVACAGLAWAEDAGPYPPLREPLIIEQVPGAPIYYTLGNPGVPGQENEGHTSNAGFIVTSDGVVVFDALGTPSLGWNLLAAIRKATAQPVRYNVVSHYHADHIYGLQAFKDHSASVIIAQQRATEYREDEETSGERADQRLDQRKQVLYPWVDSNTRVVPPDITFETKATLYLGGRRFVILYAGPAHSASDSMMLVEPDGVLFAGDVVQNSRIPFMNADDVDTANWLRSLGEIAKLEPKFIIPGHGRPSTAVNEAIAFTRDYITYVRDAMGKAAKDWVDFNVAYEQTDWSKYKNLPAFDANNRGNAYRIFLEMEQSAFKTDKPAQ
jgi:glyoxylase-like metal-dependent hydrolase (beta-lactamase superfamily II)